MAEICSVLSEDHRATYWHIVPDSGTLSRVLTANIQLVIISVSVPAVPNTHTCFHNNRLRLAASAQNLPVLSNSLVARRCHCSMLGLCVYSQYFSMK